MLKNICFSGGALKGWAYIGTIRALNELIEFKNIETVVGVSIGSLFGLFYVLQLDYRDILNFMVNLDYSELIDLELDTLVSNECLIHGAVYREKIKEIISLKINPDITFIELYRDNGKNYTNGALNITTSKMEYFNYLVTPDVKVVDSVVASSSIPIAFPSVKIGDSFYYDGFLCNNCPVDILPELSTIAFDLDIDVDTSTESKSKILHFFESLSKLIHNSFKKESHSGLVHKILLPRFSNETLNVNQTKDDMFNLYMHGYISSKNILFDNFKAIKN